MKFELGTCGVNSGFNEKRWNAPHCSVLCESLVSQARPNQLQYGSLSGY